MEYANGIKSSIIPWRDSKLRFKARCLFETVVDEKSCKDSFDNSIVLLMLLIPVTTLGIMMQLSQAPDQRKKSLKLRKNRLIKTIGAIIFKSSFNEAIEYGRTSILCFRSFKLALIF